MPDLETKETSHSFQRFTLEMFDEYLSASSGRAGAFVKLIACLIISTDEALVAWPVFHKFPKVVAAKEAPLLSIKLTSFSNIYI